MARRYNFYPKSLKNRVMLVLCTLFLLVWGGFSLLLYYKADYDLMSSTSRSLDHANNELTLMIKSEVRAMTSIVENIARFDFSSVYNENPSIELPVSESDLYPEVSQLWSMLSDVRRTRFLQYYGKDGNLLNEWGSHLGDRLSNVEFRNFYRRPYVSSWFSCKELCFINVFSMIETDDSNNMGSLRVGLLLDDIIHNLNELNTMKVIFFRSRPVSQQNPDVLTVAGKHYPIESATNYNLFQKITSQLHAVNTDHAIVINNGGKYYSIKLFNGYKNQGLYYLLSKEITKEYNNAWSIYSYAVCISAVLLAFSLIVFYFILSKAAMNFKIMARLMMLIGRGEFDKLEKNIPISYLKYRDEIGLIYKIARKSNRQLNNMKKQLMNSNIQLEKALAEKSKEHDFTESILDSSDIVIIVSDYNNNISLHNKFSINLFGHGHIKNGKPVSDFLKEGIDLDLVWEVIGQERVCRSHSSLFINDRPIYLDWIHCAMPKSYGQHKMLSLGVDISRHVKLEKRIRQVAEYDQLTQLMNRKKFNSLAEQLLVNSDGATYVAMDLDYFKLVNDSMGHQAGDQLLVNISGIFLRCCEQYDAIAGRMGGDEFAMLIPCSDRDKVHEIFNVISRDLSRIRSGLKHFSVSVSCGAAFYPDNAQQLEQLSLLADTAMYENKRLKNSNINFYSGKEKILSLKMEQKYYASLISKILDEDMISLYFQPIVSMHDYKTIGIEILIRVFDQQTKSSMPTDKIISYAEKTGRVIDIDLQVLSKILSVVKKKGITHDLMINISNLSIANKKISEEIYHIIKESGVPFSQIVFEIIESSEIENIDAIIRFIRSYKKLGVRFALDDFGDGFFSFFYLKVLPVDFLKIDKSIILDTISDPKNHFIIQAITQLADNLGIKVVAEGVEDEEILAAISGYHISYIQGYHIARPQPITTLKTNTTDYQPTGKQLIPCLPAADIF